ncbi:MAG: M18 family aminopeptidase [Clostridia bacterium]|nr:M18 family aminopeptidase [Clostridia bacterium]
MSEMKKYAEKLLAYLDNAPTAFQSVDELEKLLLAAGAVELCESEEWQLEKGKLYYMKKAGTQIAAFRIGGEPRETGFRIGAAHHDAPGFRVKTVPSSVDLGYERLLLEQYGGTLVHGWVDRPLAIAGCVYVKDEEKGFRAVNVNMKKPVLLIPSAAPHVKRGQNDGASFSVQNEIRPFFAACPDGKTTFTKYLADYIGVSESDILSYELAPYDASPACFVGVNEEFISVPRLDDCAMAHAIISGMCEMEESAANSIAVIFDHEEIGSNSDRGARCNTLMQLVDRICEKLGYNTEDKYRALASSMLFSADQAHATHPSYLGIQDPQLKVKLGGGPVLKLNYKQSYSTSARGTAFFRTLCEKEGIPYQMFNNHSDTGGGGTIGPILSANYGVCSVDIGNPTIAMHAVREFGGTDDGYYMAKLFEAFFAGK